MINFPDFAPISNNFGMALTNWAEGSYNIDTVTNFADFAELSNRFGMDFNSQDPTHVPEPAAWLLNGGGMLSLLRRRNP